MSTKNVDPRARARNERKRQQRKRDRLRKSRKARLVEAERKARPSVVLDTCVWLEISSWHDYVNAVEALDKDDLNAPKAVLRRQKARDSWALALHFHEAAVTTFCFLDEAIDLHTQRVPPDSPPEDLKLHYTKMFLYFVKPYLLPRWITASEPRGTATFRSGEADAFLVRRAKEYNAPFITHERFREDGTIEETGARGVALAGDVTPYTAGQYCDVLGLDRERLYADFLRRFEQQADAFARGENYPHVTRETLATMRGYFRHVFYGETADGRVAILRVSDLEGSHA